MKPLRVLGIETSCDETAAAVVAAAPGARPRILSNIVLSQIAEHEIYGGVVPEIAARTHVTHLDRAIGLALAEAGMDADELDAIAATAGPGLIGGVIVGLMTAKGMAAALGKPLIAVNHLEGHALSARLTEDVAFPFLLLLVSGGHCLLADVAAVGRYRMLGATIDDAVGEAFDKTAKLIGLGYPGGPAVERAARTGDPARYPLPRPLLKEDGCDFSFAGLKTAVRRVIEVAEGRLSPQDEADLAASFQAAVADILAEKATRAMSVFRARHGAGEHALVAAGGVAANAALRARLQAAAAAQGFRLAVPPPRLCTDNAAMIAWAGLEQLALGAPGEGMAAPARARWPLGESERVPA